MEEQTIVTKSTAFIRNSASLKIGVIVILALLLLIPVSMVKSLIRERDGRQNEVIQEISDKWGNSQTIGGPVLTIPYRSYVQEPNKNRIEVIRYVNFLPNSLSIKGSMEPEIRYRGIYHALLYGSDLEIAGKFLKPDFEKFDIAPENILWDKAYLSMGISDMAGIRSQINGRVSKTDISFEPGIETTSIFLSGVSASIALNAESPDFSFKVYLGVNGSRDLFFLPLGKVTTVSLSSSWPTPSFTGEFLPKKRIVDDKGFTANWNILHLNRNIPQSWVGCRKDIGESAFGVSLHPGTEIYQMTLRTAKYGVMFVLFTFTAFFLAEVIRKTRIHPIQYLLVGCAVIIFYVLLLALSEHLGFNASFISSAIAVIVLIGGYTQSILSKQMAMGVSSILVILYGYLFITLQLEDYALMVGSMGLFATLAAVMYVTRNINWYSYSREEE